jgi:hypothetical protein
LADAVNAYLAGKDDERYQCEATLDANHIGKLERGEHRWPNDPRREAFRHVLKAATDAELGFYIMRGMHLAPAVTVEERSLDLGQVAAAPSDAADGKVRWPRKAAPSADLTGREFISVPVQTANGVIAYVITRREFLPTPAATIPSLVFPEYMAASVAPVTSGLTDVADLLVPYASSFAKMRAHEDQVAGDGDQTTGAPRVIREGKTDGWKGWMTPELATFFTGEEFRTVAKGYGYDLSGMS